MGRFLRKEVHGCVEALVKSGDHSNDKVSHYSDQINQREEHGMENLLILHVR